MTEETSTDETIAAHAAWLEDRRKGLGGSDVAALFGASAWMSPYTLYLDKIGELPDKGWHVHLEIGHALEPLTRRLYAEDSGRRVRPNSANMCHPKYEFMRATTDGFIDGREDDPRVGVFEGKTTHIQNLAEWKRSGASIGYQLQVTHYMECHGLEWGSIAVLVPGAREPLLWQDIERDAEFSEMMIEVEGKFWNDHVLARKPPEVDGHLATEEVLKRLHPNDTGALIDMPGEATEWQEALLDLTSRKKELEGDMRLYNNRVRDALGAATYGILPDGSGWSCKTQARQAYMAKAGSSRVLRKASAKSLDKVKREAEKTLEKLMKGIL